MKTGIIIFSVILGISFFIFNNSFAVKDSTSEESISEVITEKQMEEQEDAIFKISQKSGEAFKTIPTIRAITSNDEKAFFVQKKPFKSKETKEVLNTKFNNHLKDLKETCDLDSKNRKSDADKKLKKLNDFLAQSLQDPYMDYETALLFGDVLSIMEQKNLDSSSSFLLSYRLLYNIDENIKDYEHDWAKAIIESIQCSEKI